jgi:hypothetical protein
MSAQGHRERYARPNTTVPVEAPVVSWLGDTFDLCLFVFPVCTGARARSATSARPVSGRCRRQRFLRGFASSPRSLMRAPPAVWSTASSMRGWRRRQRCSARRWPCCCRLGPQPWSRCRAPPSGECDTGRIRRGLWHGLSAPLRAFRWSLRCERRCGGPLMQEAAEQPAALQGSVALPRYPATASWSTMYSPPASRCRLQRRRLASAGH